MPSKKVKSNITKYNYTFFGQKYNNKTLQIGQCKVAGYLYIEKKYHKTFFSI